MKTPRPTAIAPRGITLIESLAVLCIVAIILGSALPSFARMAEKRQLEGTVAQLATDIQHVRSLAVAENNGHRLAFGHGPAGSCYVVHTGPAQGCRCEAGGAVQCDGDASARRSVFFPAEGPVQVRANVGSILFHPVHGTSTPTGTLRVVARSGASVHQIINLMGRTRACSPNGVSGYPAC